jgi:hypothetical protein
VAHFAVTQCIAKGSNGFVARGLHIENVNAIIVRVDIAIFKIEIEKRH